MGGDKETLTGLFRRIFSHDGNTLYLRHYHICATELMKWKTSFNLILNNHVAGGSPVGSTETISSVLAAPLQISEG